MIPKGIYCHDEKGLCPYWSTVSVGGIPIYWCNYLQKGGVGNISDSDFEILAKIHNNDEFERYYPLFLLWDQVKECGINSEYEEEEI